MIADSGLTSIKHRCIGTIATTTEHEGTIINNKSNTRYPRPQHYDSRVKKIIKEKLFKKY